jgi:hypothetical protein
MSTTLTERPLALDPAECWNVIERVAATPSLKRAVRLREFLLYVATKSLKEGRKDIHEQEIGETVFARPRSYDTSKDNIVRVSATELRKRVDAYFHNEGIAEPIIFEIPRGSYLPAFHLRETESMQPSAIPTVQQPVVSEAAPKTEALPSRSNLTLWIVSAVALILAIACLYLLQQNASLRQRIQQSDHQQSLSYERPGGSGASRT